MSIPPDTASAPSGSPQAAGSSRARPTRRRCGASSPVGAEVARRETPLLLFRVPRFVRERYFVVRLPSPEIDTARLAETEVDPVLGVRWWTLETLESTRDVVEPPALIGLARRIAAGDGPAAPVRLG